MRRRKPSRVMGPYQEQNRWRVVIIERGKRKAVLLPNREEAQCLNAEVERDLARLSSRKLGKFVGSYMERDVAAVTPQRAAALHRAAVDRRCPTSESELYWSAK